MNGELEDHGLPLVQLKERRRDLFISLMARKGPLSERQLREIAELQLAITAMEAVICDLDAELEVIAQERKKQKLRLI
jgi:hypothetical protein